jgi:hypothetical protein
MEYLLKEEDLYKLFSSIRALNENNSDQLKNIVQKIRIAFEDQVSCPYCDQQFAGNLERTDHVLETHHRRLEYFDELADDIKECVNYFIRDIDGLETDLKCALEFLDTIKQNPFEGKFDELYDMCAEIFGTILFHLAEKLGITANTTREAIDLVQNKVSKHRISATCHVAYDCLSYATRGKINILTTEQMLLMFASTLRTFVTISKEVSKVKIVKESDIRRFLPPPTSTRSRPDKVEPPPHRKVKLCVHFTNTGTCPKGDRCGFAHGEHELQKIPCKFFQTGSCRNSPCEYAH